MFQIPEGTFGTTAPGGGSTAWTRVSNPGRNVWDHFSSAALSSSLLSFKSRKERLGPDPEIGNVVESYDCFKSRKERLGQLVAPLVLRPVARFKSRKERLGLNRNIYEFLPKRSFKSRKERLGRADPRGVPGRDPVFQIPEGTFGTPPRPGPRGRGRTGFKSRKERLGLSSQALSGAGSSLFQIPEGTFGTTPRYGPGKARKPCFKSRKERLGRGRGLRSLRPACCFKSRKERLGRTKSFGSPCR